MGILICIVLLSIITVGVIALYTPILNRANQGTTMATPKESIAFIYPEAENYSIEWSPLWQFSNAGFKYAYSISILFVVLLAILLPFIKTWELGKGIASKIPFEINAIGVAITIGFYRALLSMAMETATGNFIIGGKYEALPKWIIDMFDYCYNYIAWMMVFGVWFVAILSIRQLFSLGFKRYLKEKTITGRLIIWLIKKTKLLFSSLAEINLTDSSNKAIIKILAVNFVILVLLCSIWLFGIAALIVYTIILFFVLRKYLDDIKKKYAVLLHGVSKIAEGNLDVKIEEDLGIFDPLKEKLIQVQFGFKKAVEEETKSQKMKTELITNVSHDLKTPLTAIITYISLLKEENVTEEDRNSYIDTLDKKSQRLKSLIEDLFEISKASSNNVSLNLVEMDLVALIKQVLLELDDKIIQSEVEFRPTLPAERVILTLDSEKTYRIFENLIINITKYAMPFSRAYINMSVTKDCVKVVLRNISAVELEFNLDEISERFARGDKSRNTEGSGLGLAIVKSFVELQGGKFQIFLDGDLFKAVIEWEKNNQEL